MARMLLAAIAVMVLAPVPVQAAPPSRPNIVVVMIDDFAGDASRRVLSRMPAIRSLFIEQGVTLTHHYGNDPLCCPARAGFLTGLYTHHHGVVSNDGRRFRPGETIATALDRRGYHTMIVGKYLNGLSHGAIDKTPPGWDRAAVTGNGYFTDWWVQGVARSAREYHTDVLTRRATSWLREAPPDQPVFMFLSAYAGHKPNTPAERHRGHPRCDDVPRYAPPSYDEADVSDKAAWVRALPRMSDPTGWPLRGVCEAIMSVDELVAAVATELDAQGRLDDTLMVFVNDNGIGWGAHRIRHKSHPYANRLVGYARWPARWGTTPRTVDGHAQLTDWAPTFAALAGGRLGPYPTGQSKPDGVDLLELLDGGREPGRDALLEEHRSAFDDGRAEPPPWWATRTTDGRWHYIEYDTGEVELYDLAEDPWELVNVAEEPAYAAVRVLLAEQLAQLRT